MIRSGVSICLINRNEPLEFDRETLQSVSQERLPFQIQFTRRQFKQLVVFNFKGCSFIPLQDVSKKVKPFKFKLATNYRVYKKNATT